MAGKEMTVTLHMTQDGEEIRQTVTGRYMEKDGEHILSYTDHTGNMHTRVIMRMGPERMRMKRIGALRSEWLFNPSEPYLVDYRSPYGDMLLEVRTKLYRCRRDGTRVRVHLEYELYQEKTRAAVNVMRITLAPPDEKNDQKTLDF